MGNKPKKEITPKQLKDPDNPEHEEKFEWLPGDFDAEKFDIEYINRELGGS